MLAFLSGLALLALLAAALAWMFAKPLAEWGLSRALGHPVSITGRFMPYVSPSPGFVAAGLQVAAPRGCAHPSMLSIDRLSVVVDGAALLHGSLIVDELVLKAPRLVAERCAGGRLNWSGGTDDHNPPALAALSGLPPVRRLQLADGHLQYAGAAQKQVQAGIARLAWRETRPGPDVLRASGSLTGRIWDIGVALRRDGAAAWRLSDISFRYGAASLQGTARLATGDARPSIAADLRVGGPGAATDLTHLWNAVQALREDVPKHGTVPAWLRGFDALVGLAAGPARVAGVDLRRMHLRLALEQGVVTLDPLIVASDKGELRASLRVDARGASPRGRISVASDGFPLALLPGEALEGYLQGRAAVAFAGTRIREASAQLRYRAGAERKAATDVRIVLQAEHGAAFPVHLTARGSLRGDPLELAVRADPMVLPAPAGTAHPVPLELDARLGAARLAAQGSLGPAGALKLGRARLTAGRSSLQASGTLDDIAQPRRVDLELHARVLRQADLGKLADALDGLARRGAQRDGWIDWLGQVDAHVEATAARVVVDRLPAIHDVALQARLQHGRLDLNRLRVGTADGSVVAEAHLAGIGGRVRGEVQAHIRHLRPDRLLAALAVERSFPGVLDGTVSLGMGELGTGSRQSLLHYRAPSKGTRIEVRLLQTAQATGLDLTGRYRNEPFELHVRGGPPRALAVPGAYPFSLRFTALATRGTLSGTVRAPLRLDGLQARLTLAGPNPRRIEPVVGFRLPELPPYRLAGPLRKQGGLWTFGPFTGSVGDSDLDGRVVADFVPGRPRVTATLHSKRFDLDDLAGVVGGAPGVGADDLASAEQRAKHAALSRRTTLFPNEDFDLAQITKMNAQVSYAADHVDADVVPLESLRLELRISRHGLALAPLSAVVAGGRVRGRFQLTRAAGARTPRGALQFTIDDVRLARLLAKLGTDVGASGRISGHGAFTTSGASVAAMLSSLDGGMRLSMNGGTVDALLVELAGLDLGEALLLWLGEERKVPIRCAGILARADNGVLDFGGSVLDTTDTRFSLSGTVGFPRERLDLRLTAHPKDFSLLAARAPFVIEGRFRDPDLHPYWPALGARAAAAGALALLAPPAALLALVEPGLGDSTPCPEGR